MNRAILAPMLLAVAWATPVLSHHTVTLENASDEPWILIFMPEQQADGGRAPNSLADLVVSLRDEASGKLVVQEPIVDQGFLVPAKAKLTLDTKDPLDNLDRDYSGASFRFRFSDEAGHGTDETVLLYTVSLSFACTFSSSDSGQVLNSVMLYGGGPQWGQLVSQDPSFASVTIIANHWPSS